MKNVQSSLISVITAILCITILMTTSSCSSHNNDSVALSYTYSSGIHHGIPYYEVGTEPILFIGHRGFSSEYPENTPASFIGAAEAGFDGIEVDVWESENGDVMVFHDTTTDRMCGISESIVNVNEDNRISFPIIGGNGNDGKSPILIPTLDETLKIAKEQGLTVYLHIKPGHGAKKALLPETTQKIIALIKTHKMENQTVIFSKRTYVAESFCGQGLRVGLLSENPKVKVNKKKVDWLAEHGCDTYIVSKMDCISKDSFGKEFVDYCHDRNIEVGVYIARTVADIDYLISIGADFSFSNFDLRSPLETKNVLENTKPVIKECQNTDAGIYIEWSSILGNLCGYRIYRQKEDYGYELIAEIPAGSHVTALTDHVVDQDKTYSYKVIGFASDHNGTQTIESEYVSINLL